MGRAPRPSLNVLSRSGPRRALLLSLCPASRALALSAFTLCYLAPPFEPAPWSSALVLWPSPRAMSLFSPGRSLLPCSCLASLV